MKYNWNMVFAFWKACAALLSFGLVGMLLIWAMEFGVRALAVYTGINFAIFTMVALGLFTVSLLMGFAGGDD
jgi:hypothetical protein